MATTAGEIEVKLTLKATDFNKLMGQSKAQVQDFGSVSKAVMGEVAKIFTFVAIAGFFKDSMEAFAEQELASAKLVRALENQGHATKETVSHLEQMATALSSVSAVADEVITGAQAQLVSFGLEGDALDKTTRAALDLSAGMGIDLTQATQLLGKAFVGETGALGRYGIKIADNLGPTEKFAAVLGQVNSRFSGQAAAQAATFTGKMSLLKVEFNELQETIGKLLSGKSGGLIKWLMDITTSLNNTLKASSANSSGWMLLANIIGTTVISTFILIERAFFGLIGTLVNILAKLPLIGIGFRAFAVTVDMVNKGIDLQAKLLKAALDASTANKDGLLKNEKDKEEDFDNKNKKHMDVQQAMSDWLQKNQEKDFDQWKTLNKDKEDELEKFAKLFVTTHAQMWDQIGHFVDKFMDGLSEGLAQSIMEGKSFADSMRQMFRQMATEILGWIIKMIIKMLIFLALREAAEKFGPVGMAVSSAMGAAANSGLTGMASGGTISEPSILTGLRSGRQHIVGEAGPEAVVPMNMANSEGGGRGSINISISGQFIEGDAGSWQKLINEKIVPAIRRHTMINPTGNFNRRRGVA